MRKIIFTIISILTVSLFIFTTGCGKETDTIFKSPITDISVYSTLDIELFEDVQPSDVVWSSSDDNTLTVDNGKVFAVKTGEATITAKIDGSYQKHTFNVVDSEYSPIIEVEDFGLLIGDKVTIYAPLIYKGNICTETTYELASSNEEIVSVDTDGNLFAKSLGSADITVTATWKNILVFSKTVKCSVNENFGIKVAQRNFKLYSISNYGENYYQKTAEIIDAKVINNGSESNAEISWQSSDESIATVSGTLIEAKSAGRTTIIGTAYTASNQKITTSIEVEVLYAPIETFETLLVDLNKRDASFDSSAIFGEGNNILKMEDVQSGSVYSVQDNKIGTDIFAKTGSGEYEFKVYCNEVQVVTNVTVVVADYVLYEKEDLAGIENYHEHYIALANDISNVGDFTNVKAGINSWEYFSGTFNGLGHTISDIVIKNNESALFHRAKNGAVFKNIGMKNVTLASNNTAALVYYVDGYAFSSQEGLVIFDNVNIEINKITSSTATYSSNCGGLVALCFNGNVFVSNSIVKFIDNSGNSNLKKYNGAVFGRCRVEVNFEDCYVITNGNVCGTTNHTYNIASETLNQYEYKFNDEQAFKSSRDNNMLSFDNFSAYWDMSKNIPQIGR